MIGWVATNAGQRAWTKGGAARTGRAGVQSARSAGWPGRRGVAPGNAGKPRLPDGHVRPRLTGGQPGARTARGWAQPRPRAEGEVGASRGKTRVEPMERPV